MTLAPVPPGHVATIVTSLEMLAPPAPAPPPKSALRLVRWEAPVDRNRYRALFREIGSHWLWCGRLTQDDAALSAILDVATTQVWVATRRDGVAVGLLELDFAFEAVAELTYFGLVPGMTGTGHGGWLMAHALHKCWRPGISRVWVHTCDLDHPSALGFYRRHGFTPFARAVEVYEDPRHAGLYPADVAPQVPLL